VEFTAGLFRAKQADYLHGLLKVLGDLSGLLAVPQLSAALTVAEPVARSLQGLLEDADGDLELGLHDTWVGAGGTADNLLRSGYIAVIRATEAELDKTKLTVVGQRLQLSGKPVTGHSYMLLRIESRTERDDWNQLSAITAPMEQMRDAMNDHNIDKAKDHLRAAKRAALGSADRTRLDARRVAKSLHTVFDQDVELLLGPEGVKAMLAAPRPVELADVVGLVDPGSIDLGGDDMDWAHVP